MERVDSEEEEAAVGLPSAERKEVEARESCSWEVEREREREKERERAQRG